MKGGNNYLVYPGLSYLIVGVLFDVYNNLGPSYKESVYQKAIVEELNVRKINFKPQASYLIKYKNKIIGRRQIDFLIEDKIVLEIKAGNHYKRQNYLQVCEYLKVTRMKLAILANFTGSGVKYKRIVNTR